MVSIKRFRILQTSRAVFSIFNILYQKSREWQKKT